MRRLLSVAAALTLIASPASAGIRDDYEQQNKDAELLLQRCKEIKAEATHFTEKLPLVGSSFYVVSGNNIVACTAYNTGFMQVDEYTLGETYRLSPQQNFEDHLENGELVQYLQQRHAPKFVERHTDIKRMRR